MNEPEFTIDDQEPDATPKGEGGLVENDDILVVDDDAVIEALQSADEPPASPSPPARLKDPVVSTLVVVALLLVVVLLATTVAVYIYLTTLNRAPRTIAERGVAAAEASTNEEPKRVLNWVSLAYAYADVGRYDDAMEAIARGRRLPSSERLETVKADILRSRGDYEAALKQYDVAEDKVKQLLERNRKARVKKGVTADLQTDLLMEIYWGRALTKEKLGKLEAATDDVWLALNEVPTEANAWLKYGQLKEQLGEKKDAEEAYRRALQFIPDMQEAKEGLERLGKR